jgi:hypothetical protein
MYDQLKSWLDLHIVLDSDEWQRVQKSWILRDLRKKEFLFQQGEICDFIAFVNRGCLRYFSFGDTGDTIYHFFLENSFAWDMDSFLLQQPTQRNMQAIEPTELLILSLDRSGRLEQEIPSWQKFRLTITENAYEAVNAGSLKVARSLETLATAWVQFAVASGLFPNLGLKALRR